MYVLISQKQQKKTDKINLKMNNFSLFSLPRTDILSINSVNFSKYTGI